MLLSSRVTTKLMKTKYVTPNLMEGKNDIGKKKVQKVRRKRKEKNKKHEMRW